MKLTFPRLSTVQTARWPSPVIDVLMANRHAEGEYNLLERQARTSKARAIRAPEPERLLGITRRGRLDAFLVGRYLATLPKKEQPTLFGCSPTMRTVMTLQAVLEGAGFQIDKAEWVVLPALQDRNVGDRKGFPTAAKYFEAVPEELAKCVELGPYDYAYPRGESYRDLIRRVSAGLQELEWYARGHRSVFLGVHHSTVRAFAAMFGGLSETQLVELCEKPIPNGSITRWECDPRTRLMQVKSEVWVPSLESKTECGDKHCGGYVPDSKRIRRRKSKKDKRIRSG